ncbi:hypothetical protein RMATCC62417_18153 [Rhizopus microsporus]|nr:hypothetical protein RMATCC62417_18153 [Rhizopus microsporus]
MPKIKGKAKANKAQEHKNDRRKKQASFIAEQDDFDLDAVVNELIWQSQRPASETRPHINPTVECPICSQLYPRNRIELHASDCTGGFVDDAPSTSKKKNTIATGVALNEAKRKKTKSAFIENVNYYVESDDLLAVDGVGFNNEVTDSGWETRGQIRFT